MSKNKKSLFRSLSSANEIKSIFSLTGKMISSSREDIQKQSIKETFEEALERFNITKENRIEFLNEKYKSLRNHALISYFFCALLILINIYNYFASAKAIFLVIFSFISIYFFLIGLTSSFRCYQIKIEKLGHFKEFFFNVKNWIPKKIILEDK